MKSISYAVGNRATGILRTDYSDSANTTALNDLQTMNVTRKVQAFNPLWINQRQLNMGKYYNYYISRIFILYDDKVADPIVFTYPA